MATVDKPTVLTTEVRDDSPYQAEILPALRKAQLLSGKWHAKIKQWRALYNLSQAKGKKKKPKEEYYPDPTALNVADIAVGVILANDIEWTAMGFSPDPEEQRVSSRIEKYLAGTLDVNSEREERHIVYETILNFVRDGCGCLYTVWDDALALSALTMVDTDEVDPMTGQPVRIPAYTETPIKTRPIDPLKLHLLPGGPYRWSWIFLEEDMSVYDFEIMFNARVPKYEYMTAFQKQETKGKMRDCWRYFHKDVPVTGPDGQPVFNDVLGRPETQPGIVVQHALVYDDMMVWPLQDMPSYKTIPYLIGFFKPVDADNPEQWGHSIIAPLETTLRFLESAINRRMYQIDIFTSMPMIVRAAPGRDVEIDPGFDNYEVLEPDEDITWPKWPGNPPDFESQINFYRARLQQSGFTDVIFGQGPSDAAGYAINLLTDQNRIRLIQPVKHLEMLFGRWAKHVLRLTREFAPNAAVRVYGRMKGKDFAEQVMGSEAADYMVRARFDPEFPNDKVRNHAMGQQASAHLSLHTLLQTYYDIDQPDDEIERRMQEQAMMSPEMQRFLLLETLMEEAQRGNMAAALVVQQMMASPPAGQQGRPPNPMAPDQPLGLQGPTGQPPPQAQGGEPPGQSVADRLRAITEAAPGMDGQI